MRVYVSLQNPSYLKNLEPVVCLLLDRGHSVILGICSQGDDTDYLANFADFVDTGHLVVTKPPERKDLFSRIANGLPMSIDYLFFLGPEFKDVPYSKVKRRRRMAEFARRLIRKYRLRYGWRRRAALACLQLLEEAIPANAATVEHFRAYRPDLLLVSPLLDTDGTQIEHVRAAKALRIPTVYAVHSWDNLTSKGLIRMRPERIAVWNKIQEREAVKLHRQKRRRIVVTGAYNFDDWFASKPSMDRASFLRHVGLPTDRAVILYLCSALYFPKTQSEESFVVEWLKALRRCSDERLREAAVLVRPHPKRLGEFNDLSIFGGDPSVAIWPRQGTLPISDEPKRIFFDSLYHADATVALNTTAMIDAAIVGRPVCTILDERHRVSQEMTLHFPYLSNPEMGLVRVARDWDAHFSQLSEALAPDPDTARTKSFVETFVRPHGLDQACAPRLADCIESLARKGRINPLRGVWLRPIALPWLKWLNRRAELAEEHEDWRRAQSLEDWQERQIFIDRLCADKGIRN